MRQRLLLDAGWRFHKGDIPDSGGHGYLYTYMHTKTERGRGPASIDYDDSGWDIVDLPHDYVVEGRPAPEANPVHGSLPRENAWYRRFFRLEEEDRKKRIHIEFEGICTQSRIWVNGCLMGTNDSAYTEIDLDITDIARYGDDLNEISVYVDNTEYEGWWYEGGGIYRHAWLVKTEDTAVDHFGIYVHPVRKDGDRWQIPVETKIRNDSYETRKIRLRSAVKDDGGREIAAVESGCGIAARECKEVHQEMETEAPALWSVETPNLYRLCTQIWLDGALADEVTTSFGFRTAVFDPDRGFLLNGVPAKIKGMCIHEDHGGLGAALPDNIKEYRVKRLKEMGCNGYRFSHNPHSRETLDACDRLGMLVMDENRWFESSKDGIRRLENMVLRDRNHPSVIMWSVGNEESLQAGEQGRKIMESMKHAVHRLDRERPVMMAMHTGLLEDGAAAVSDVIGMNYNIDLCDEIHRKYPDKPIIFSEVNNASEEDILGDREAGIRTWQIVDTKPYMSGMFGWTGMDYRGEHDYPGLFAPCGCMDQNGYDKDSCHLYQVWWRDEKKVYIQPHWNHRTTGEEVTVRVFSTGDEVTLYLNGRELGTQKNDPYFQTDWQVRYEPGVLRAVARKDGRFEAETERRTTGKACSLSIKLENPEVKSGCREAAVFTVTALDENGYAVPDADNEIRLTECRGGRLVVTGNGDVKDQSDRRQPVVKLYDGRAQILIEALEPSLAVRAEADGLEAAKTEVRCEPGRMPKCAPVTGGRYLTKWEMAAWCREHPEKRDGNYGWMRSFQPVEVGHGTQFRDLLTSSGYLVYHCRADIPGRGDENAGENRLFLRFELLEGSADVTVEIKGRDGSVLHRCEKSKPWAEPDELAIEIRDCERAEAADIWVCLGVSASSHGITKPVRWEYRSMEGAYEK